MVIIGAGRIGAIMNRENWLVCNFCGQVFSRKIVKFEQRCPKCREYDIEIFGMTILAKDLAERWSMRIKEMLRPAYMRSNKIE